MEWGLVTALCNCKLSLGILLSGENFGLGDNYGLTQFYEETFSLAPRAIKPTLAG